MRFRLVNDEGAKPFLRDWADRGDEPLDRLEAAEAMINYWISLSKERDVRIEILEDRVAEIEADAIPSDYGCVARLAAGVDRLEATIWEINRRMSLQLARGQSA